MKRKPRWGDRSCWTEVVLLPRGYELRPMAGRDGDGYYDGDVAVAVELLLA